ncbi:uncharacterized protein LOC129591135 [Paramacrobiotus metropolitanus]|uniref:uncharacterized protein LOC129591135 n=1 Tax=Paramacrobiotus metropolitanus TaxID=2943436 RepID=UPI002445BAB6|nr:uncharacterized protein LOC129591135 [Paramacrobiotus metropolitanus]
MDYKMTCMRTPKPCTHGCAYAVLGVFLLLNGQHDCQLPTPFPQCRHRIRSKVIVLIKAFYWCVVSFFLLLSALILVHSTIALGILTFIEYSRYVFGYEAAVLMLIAFQYKQSAFHAICARRPPKAAAECPENKCGDLLFSLFYALVHIGTLVLIMYEYTFTTLQMDMDVNYFEMMGGVWLPLWAWQCVVYPLMGFPQMLSLLVVAILCRRICEGIRLIRCELTESSVEEIRAKVTSVRKYIQALEEAFSLILLMHIAACSLTVLGFVQSFRNPKLTGSATVLIPVSIIALLAASMLVPIVLTIKLQDELELALEKFLSQLDDSPNSPTVYGLVEREISSPDLAEIESLRNFLRSVRQMPPRLTGGRFFIIDRGFIAAMIGFFATYAVLVKEILKGAPIVSYNTTRTDL